MTEPESIQWRGTWGVPPALRTDPAVPDLIPGIRLLQEWAEPTSQLLWQTVREIRLWAIADGSEPPLLSGTGLVAPEAYPDIPIAVCNGLLLLRSLVRAETRPALAGTRIRLECAAVAQWAALTGAGETRLEFALASAEADPSNSGAALHVGEAAASTGRKVMGKTWVRRAIALARRERAWSVYAQAYIALGDAAMVDRRTGFAARAYRRAATLARRKGLWDLRYAASRGQARASCVSGDLRRAEAILRRLLRGVRGRMEQRTGLLTDLADVLAAQGGSRSDDAVRILQKLADDAGSVEDRVEMLIRLTVAAGQAQMEGVMRAAWSRAEGVIGGMSDPGGAAELHLRMLQTAGVWVGPDRATRLARRMLSAAPPERRQEVYEAARVVLPHLPPLLDAGRD